MKPLKETHFSLKDYVDFPKVAANVEAISIKLNQLNYLIGQEDMAAAIKHLWDENPKVFSVLDVLIAVRAKDKKKAIDAYGNIHLVSDYFTSPEQVTVFLNETGLTEVFQKKQIKSEALLLTASLRDCLEDIYCHFWPNFTIRPVQSYKLFL